MLGIPFSLACIAFLICSAWAPFLHLHFFAPFLALTYYAKPFSKAVGISLFCGLLLDLFSSEFRFGVMTLSSVATTLLLYSQKKHFFEDKPLALSLFTMVISTAFFVVEICLVYLFDRDIPITLATFCIDGIFMSAIDGLYAFLWFTCPLKLYKYLKKKGWRKIDDPA